MSDIWDEDFEEKMNDHYRKTAMTDAQSRERFEIDWAKRNGYPDSAIAEGVIKRKRINDTYLDTSLAIEWFGYRNGMQAALSHPTPQRDKHITRMLDQLSGGVGTFLQADGEWLVEYVRGLERTIEIAHGDLDMHEGLIADLKRQLAERDAEIEQLKENVSARSRLQP